MKKTIFALFLGLTTMTAQASAHRPQPTQTHSAIYNTGYSKGKSDAYNNVAKTMFFVGTAVVVGVIIYQLGKDSNWTAHDGQVGYRF